MPYCDHCCRNVSLGPSCEGGQRGCNLCGKVLEDYNYSLEPTFTKNADGQAQVSGHNVDSVESGFLVSRQRTLDRAHRDIKCLSSSLGVYDDNVANQALKFYTIALHKNFTRGRRSEQVQAACLYISFRVNNKPFLLIDLSNNIRTNVYVLGAVFLQLCKLFSLEKHDIVQKLVDPSLFIYKYTANLLKERNAAVSETALSIIASMKRDWMQTGRKPSGLCGAALYMAALAHGFKCSKSDILRLVHVCEATLTKRLVEFEKTESASLTIEELNSMAKEHEKQPIKVPNGELKQRTSEDLICVHQNSAVPHFALGLCKTCYEEFDKLSGGLCGGLDPPAFQRAEKERMTKSLFDESANKSDDMVEELDSACGSRKEELHVSEPESIGPNDEYMAVKEGSDLGESHKDDDMNTKSDDESETLSDIDDQEVDGYLHNEEEKHYKKIIWENMNREYLEEQAAKEAAAAVAKKAFGSEDALAARAAKRRRAQEAKNAGPAQSAAEATRQMLTTKRLSSKVNYDRLEKLFNDPAPEQNPKKVRFELAADNHDNFESELEDKIKDNVVESEDDFTDGDMAGEYEDTFYNEDTDSYGYEDVGYGYDDY